MAKTLEFTYKNVDYTLEFTRKTVTRMEQNGFNIKDIDDKPMTVLPELFEGSFKAHHPYLKPSMIDEIYTKFTNKVELVNKLAEMYYEPLAALMEEPEEDEGNITWSPNW